MEVGLSIAQMQRGMDVEGFYLLKAAFAKVTASGKPFLSAVLADTSGTIEAKVWDYSGPIGERDVGKVLKVRGSVSDYRGMPQLTVDKLRLAEDNDRVDVSKLVSVAPIDREAGYDEVKALVSTIEDADYRAVCEEMLRRHEAAFRTIPAAKSVHHGFLSGLLMHTLNMLRLADFLSAQYADTVNRSLLLTGTLLHDFAKEQEFTFSELGLVTDYRGKGDAFGAPDSLASRPTGIRRGGAAPVRGGRAFVARRPDRQPHGDLPRGARAAQSGRIQPACLRARQPPRL